MKNQSSIDNNIYNNIVSDLDSLKKCIINIVKEDEINYVEFEFPSELNKTLEVFDEYDVVISEYKMVNILTLIKSWKVSLKNMSQMNKMPKFTNIHNEFIYLTKITEACQKLHEFVSSTKFEFVKFCLSNYEEGGENKIMFAHIEGEKAKIIKNYESFKKTKEMMDKMKLNDLFESDSIDTYKNNLERTIQILKDYHKDYPTIIFKRLVLFWDQFVKESIKMTLKLMQNQGKVFYNDDNIKDFIKIETGIHGKLLTFNNDIYKFVDNQFDKNSKLKEYIISYTSDNLTKFKDRIILIKKFRNYHKVFRPTMQDVLNYNRKCNKDSLLSEYTLKKFDDLYMKCNDIDISDLSSDVTLSLQKKIKEYKEESIKYEKEIDNAIENMLKQRNSIHQKQIIFKKYAGWLNNEYNFDKSVRNDTNNQMKLFVIEDRDKLIEQINKKSYKITENYRIFDKDTKNKKYANSDSSRKELL